MVLVLLLSCIEYGVSEEPEAPLPGTDSSETGQTVAPPPDCTVPLAAATTVPVVKECALEPTEVDDPWNVVVEWQWAGLSTNPDIRQVIVLPVVGDITGDGTSDIAFVAYDYVLDWTDFSPADGTLVVLNSLDGSEQWSLPGYHWFSGPAIADVDSDGVAEIIAITEDGAARALSGSGQTEWTSQVLFDTTESVYPQVTVADIDANGDVEVIIDTYILDGRTGTLQLELPISDAIPYRMATAGDINLDGQQELIIGNTCYFADGTIAWSSDIQGEYGHWSAMLDVDGDPFGEVAMIGNGELGIYDSDGTPLYHVQAGENQPGPPCVADFDGDEVAEIAWASNSQFNLYELDGSVRWTRNIDDSSGLASCSGYDIDADGAYEVLYADQHQLYIFDGATGTTRFVMEGHASGTVWEYPIVADTDNDGSAEIVIASNNYEDDSRGFSGITQLGHVESGWAASGPTWSIHDFAVTNIEADGTVPDSPELPWHAHNVFRARPTVDALAIDVTSAITDVCYAGCEADHIVRVAVQVYNQGSSRVRSGVPVSLFRKDGASLSFLGLQYTTDSLDPGEGAAGMEFEIRVADIGSDGLEVRADDLGAGSGLVNECDEWNNGGPWTELECDT